MKLALYRLARLGLALSLGAALLAALSLGGEGSPGRAEAMSLQAVPGTFVSAITVLNPATNSASATVSIQFFDSSGNVVTTLNVPSPIPPGGTFFQYVPGISGLPPGTYSAVVNSDQPVYATVNLNSSNPTTGESYNGVNQAGASVYVPSVLNGYYGFNSVVVAQNAGSSSASVTLKLVGKSSLGSVNYTTPAQTIGVNASFSWDLASLASNIGTGFTGAATVNGNGQNVAVVANVYTPSITAQTPNYLFGSGNGFASGSAQAFIPGLYKNYYGFVSALLVQNIDPSQTATVQVKYSNNATDSASIPPGGSALFYTPGNNQLPNGWQGSATVTSTGGQQILASVNVQASGQAGTGLATYNGFTSGTNTVFAPGLLKSYYGFNSALTIQNVDTQPATVTVKYSNGASDSPVVLQPGQSKLFYQPGESALPNGFNGGATITSQGGKIVGLINIQGATNADQLFSTNAFGS